MANAHKEFVHLNKTCKTYSLSNYLYVLLQVPANRIGFSTMSLSQLKIMQEVISLSVFIPFAIFYMNQPFKWDYLWAGLCMVGAVYFMLRN